MNLSILKAGNHTTVETAEPRHGVDALAARRRAALQSRSIETGPQTVSAGTRQRAIREHPYSKKSPGFSQSLSNSDISLSDAMGALDEAQARSEGRSISEPMQRQGAMTPWQQQQEKLDREFGPVGGGGPQTAA